MSEAYDSSLDTMEHIKQVRTFLDEIVRNIQTRARVHDASKLEEPEKSAFDTMTPKLKGTTYGSEEYKSALAEMRGILKHHYEANSHHPEYYINGIGGMSMLDLLEMLADWKAAGMRHLDGGSLERSLRINKDRYKIPDPLFNLLYLTAKELKWM